MHQVNQQNHNLILRIILEEVTLSKTVEEVTLTKTVEGDIKILKDQNNLIRCNPKISRHHIFSKTKATQEEVEATHRQNIQTNIKAITNFTGEEAEEEEEEEIKEVEKEEMIIPRMTMIRCLMIKNRITQVRQEL